MGATTTFTLQVSNSFSFIESKLSDVSSASFSDDLAAESDVNEPKGYNGTVFGEAGYPGPDAVTEGAGYVKTFSSPNAIRINYPTLDWTGPMFHAAGCLWYLGGTTGAYPGSLCMHRYSIADNQWRHWCGDTHTDTVPRDSFLFELTGHAHNFSAWGYDPSRERFYLHAQGGSNANTEYTPALCWFSTSTAPNAAPTSGRFGVSPISGFQPGTVAAEVGEYWCVRGSGSNLIRRFDLDDGTELTPFVKPVIAGKSVVCTHNGYCYFSGDNGTFYRRQITTGPASIETLSSLVVGGSPVTLSSAGGADINYTMLVPMNQYIYAFRLCNMPTAIARGVFRYDPSTDSWSDTGTVTFPPIYTTTASEKWTVGPVPELNCCVVITSPVSDFNAGFFLWKP